MRRVGIAIIGAGPYGLSLAAHLAARQIAHRIFGRPMAFWSDLAEAGGARYLKSYCFGSNISTPRPGFTFADYSRPRGLETFEPCAIGDFSAYGRWFQDHNVPWVEPVNVARIARTGDGFMVTLQDGEEFLATRVVIATGLSGFDHTPSALASLPAERVTHTARIARFDRYQGSDVAVIGAGQSALEAAALLHEAGARPRLLVREDRLRWHRQVPLKRNLWRRLRSPLTGLGTGPKAWALTRFPGAVHRFPTSLRTRFVKNHLPAEGAWWLRDRVENRLPIQFGTSVTGASETGSQVLLQLKRSDGLETPLTVDHVIAGSGYIVDVDRLEFIDPELRRAVARIERAPRLDARFETSVAGLHIVGPASAMSFGPCFRFVVGAEYTARILSTHLAVPHAP